MLPLWRDQVLIGISPRRISMVRLRGYFGRRQIVLQYSQAINLSQSDEVSWQPAIDALSVALKESRWQKARTKVVISNSLVRYTLLPWSEVILNTKEEQKFAQFKMNERFGYIAEKWEITVATNRYGHARLISAVDAELLVNLRQLAAKSHITIQAIQPHLATALNFWRKRLTGSHLHFLMSDGEKLCTTYIEHGQIKSLNVEQMNEALTDEMVASTLQRNALLHGEINDKAQAYVFAPKQVGAASSVGQLQKIQRLHLPTNFMHDPAAFLAAGYLV